MYQISKYNEEMALSHMVGSRFKISQCVEIRVWNFHDLVLNFEQYCQGILGEIS